MKKQYLSFAKHNQYGMPRRGMRSMRFLRFGSGCFKTDGNTDDTATDEDKEIKAIQSIQKQVGDFAALLGDKANKEEIAALTTQLTTLEKTIKDMQAADISKALESINEANAKIWKQIADLQEEQAKGKDAGNGTVSNKGGIRIDRKEVQAFIDATFKDGRKTAEKASITIKAAETMGVATFYEGGAETDTTAFTGRMVDPTLYQRRRKKNLILDNFTIGTIGVPTLLYLVKIEEGDSESVSGDPGGADWILSGEAKPMRSFRVTTGQVEAKKVAIFSTVEDKLLRDVSSLENWLRTDLMDEMREKINDGLLNNDTGSDPNAPQGLKQEAILFTPTSGWNNSMTANTSNYIDQILAIKATFSHNKETLAFVVVSPTVITKIMALKDSENRYLNNGLVYVNNLGQLFIGGIPVVESDDEDVPDTHVLAIGADLGWKALAYGPMTFERGLNGEDFRHDRTSYRAYQEFLTYLPTHRENSVLFDTWANVKSGIEA